VPLEFRFHVSMCGSLGVGGNLLEWDQAERQLGAECIKLYKEIRHIIQFGDQYRLISPQHHNYSAVQYVSKDKSEGVLFVFRTHIPHPFNIPVIHLRGLDPEAMYSIEGFEQPRSGLTWMEYGVRVDLKNLQSKVMKITRLTA
jgi:alpha-galactosidase